MPNENPFYYNLPTRPADFVGRWPLVEEIVADLARPRPDSWAIIGGRRFGKSSVLKAIEARLLEQLAQAGPGDRRLIPLTVDLKGSATETEQNVYARIARLLGRALGRNRDLRLDLAPTRLQMVLNNQVESLSFYQFEDTLDDLASHFENHLGPLRLALLLDEVEATTRFDWSETLFNQLRALIYDGPLADTVKLVLTGAARVIQVRHEGSPLLNAVKITHLAVFSPADLQTLVARGGQILPETSAAIQKQSGGHPFIAQYLLHHLWAGGLARISPAQVEQIARQMRRQRAADLQGWWEAVGDSGQLAYALLAKADGWVDESSLVAQIPGTGQSLDQGLAALCYHGLAWRGTDGQRYHVGSGLFRDWFAQNAAQAVEAAFSAPSSPGGTAEPDPQADLLADRKALQNRLRQYRKNLAHWEGQKAKYGLNVPLDILNGIDDAQENIERIEARLAELNEQLQNLSSGSGS